MISYVSTHTRSNPTQMGNSIMPRAMAGPRDPLHGPLVQSQLQHAACDGGAQGLPTTDHNVCRLLSPPPNGLGPLPVEPRPNPARGPGTPPGGIAEATAEKAGKATNARRLDQAPSGAGGRTTDHSDTGLSTAHRGAQGPEPQRRCTRGGATSLEPRQPGTKQPHKKPKPTPNTRNDKTLKEKHEKPKSLENVQWGVPTLQGRPGHCINHMDTGTRGSHWGRPRWGGRTGGNQRKNSPVHPHKPCHVLCLLLRLTHGRGHTAG